MKRPDEVERQRAAQVELVMRSVGFGWTDNPCFECGSKVTARSGARWACPYHWPVEQLVLTTRKGATV